MMKSLDLKGIGELILKNGDQEGADETEAYVASNRVLTVRLVNNAVFEAKGVHDLGAGLRALKTSGVGFSSTADLSPKSLRKTVKSALDASKARKLPFKYTFPPSAKSPKVSGIYDDKLANLPSDKAVELAYDMIEASVAYNRKIKDNSGVFNLVEYHTIVMNSSGLTARDDGTFFEASLTATAKQGTKSSEGAESTAGRSLKELKPKDIGQSAAEMAISDLKAQRLEAGTYSIVLDPQPVAIIIEYVEELSSPPLAKRDYPLFLDKVGKRVGSKQLTLVDDPLMLGGVRSSSVDQEGTPSKKFAIIEKGVLKTFAYDSFYGAMEKRQTTGSGNRYYFVVGVSQFPGRNYNLEPIPRARNPYILPGKWKRDEILEDMKDGLLAKRFHYTRLTNPTRGDFTSVLRMGLYRIKKGQIIGALEKSRLIDNLLGIMKNVDAVSNKLTVAGSWGEYAHAPAIRTKTHVTPV